MIWQLLVCSGSIATIERLSEKRMDVVINALLEEDEAKHEKARRIFKLIK